jgi:hypothetical protein
LTVEEQYHEMQNQLRSALLACVVLGVCVPIEGLVRTSTQDSKLTWVCREPKPAEAQAMKDDGNLDFRHKPEFDPLGIAGGCMPDATCDGGKSKWTNFFG